MFGEIFFFELRSWLKRPAAYIYFGVFFLCALFIAMAVGGMLGTATFDSNTTVNSALFIASGVLDPLNTGLIGLIILVTIIAPAVYKDFQYNVHPLFFTKPISKFGYMFGRYCASLLVALFVFTGAVFGYIVGCMLPGFNQDILGPFSLMNYLQPLLLFVIPNTLLVGAIFFSLVTFSRNMVSGYIGCLALMIIQSIASSLLSDLDNRTTAAMLEPFGVRALGEITKFWTPAEQNTLLIPFEGVLLYNRLLWIGIALLITFITYYRFSFSQFISPISFFSRFRKQTAPAAATATVLSLAEIPKATQLFNTKEALAQTWFLAKFEFRKIVKSVFFLIIITLSALLMVVSSTVMGQLFGTSTYPVTYQVMQLANFFVLFNMVMVIFYSGVLVWRERDSKVDELVGASPVSSAVLFSSKLIALVLTQAVVITAIIITGISIQMYMGYYKLELGQYITELFGFRFIGFALMCVMAMAIQVFVSNKYVGFFVAALILVLIPTGFRFLEWDNGLYLFNSSGPRMAYSDMNGFGHTLFPFLVFKTYWASFSLILAVLCSLLWVRGKEKGLGKRFRMMKPAFKGTPRLIVLAALVVFLGSGGFIYYNGFVLNENTSSKEMEEIQADFEKKYKRYERTPQPRIVAVNFSADIYPEELGLKLKGHYYLKNKTRKQVDTIVLNVSEDAKINALKPGPASKLVLEDKRMGVFIHKLATPLQPGDSLRLDFDLEYFPKGFRMDRAGTAIVENGSFINSGYMPSIGYLENAELRDDAARKKYGLGRKERMAHVNDSLARMNTYIARDADWVRFECTLSTVPDQIAIAPGYLQKEWQENGRRYFHYRMDCPILNLYAFLSARYEVKRDLWKDPRGKQEDVKIEIYYHKGHEYNLDRMVKAIKMSLDYYTANFSPYQHKQVRILEFPRYASFAQSFPNTIPFSESIGFIAKIDERDPESIDYAFYVTAHEVAHQWWAHQVIGGDVQGSTVMSETMSQYSALMVMEKEYGKQAMKKFLKYEMNQYLRSRALEGKKEMPLMLVENQQYIHYNKGSVVMYALKDYIGEDTLNAALARYIKKVAYQEPPYTNSIEFLSYIRQAVPDSLKYIVSDMFETITVFENKVKSCTFEQKDGNYLVKMTVESKKFRADSLGKSREVPVNDWIDIGVLGMKETDGKKKETELFRKKYKITKPLTEIEVWVKELPDKVGIDPYNKLVDRTPDNNTRSFSDSNDGGGEGGVSVQIGN